MLTGEFNLQFLGDSPCPGTVLFVIARTFVHHARPFLVPVRLTLIIHFCSPFPDLWERSESSYPGDSECDDLLLYISSRRFRMLAMNEVLRNFDYHLTLIGGPYLVCLGFQTEI